MLVVDENLPQYFVWLSTTRSRPSAAARAYAAYRGHVYVMGWFRDPRKFESWDQSRSYATPAQLVTAGYTGFTDLDELSAAIISTRAKGLGWLVEQLNHHQETNRHAS